jgi:ATP-dependent Zn protease
MPEYPLGPDLAWQVAEPALAEGALERLRQSAPLTFAHCRIVRARQVRLPFYRHHDLLELTIEGAPGVDRAFVLHGDVDTHWLDGSSLVVHLVNDGENVALQESTVLDYVRFFLFALRADEGAFTLLEAAAEIEVAPAAEDATMQRTAEDLAAVRALWQPLRLVEPKPDEQFRAAGTVAYGNGLFAASFLVQANGTIEMVDDTPLAPLDGFKVPARPTLTPQPTDPEPEPAAQPVVPTVLGGAQATPARTVTAGLPTHSDLAVTQAAVSVLVSEAVRASLGHRLLQHFNKESQPDGPVRQLARFVEEFDPIIVIESEIPFIEDIVAGLLEIDGHEYESEGTRHAAAVSGDDTRCFVDLRTRGPGIHLISFHAYRSLWDAEWTAHQLAVRPEPVLIGCERRVDVPEPLRRVTDLFLTLPRIDERLFPAILRQVLGAPPPVRWNAGGADWVRYLVHADFHALPRLGLSPPEAVAYLRERAQARLAQVTPTNSLRLEELQGLAEARQVAEDLIADIKAARRGRIPWSAVDRGLLLVGAPGTGKTTLARAIAQACGIRFVHVSAAEWQSAGGLDLHLRAIRATFNEARRYAPSILFLDEIDSIGNRERFEGSNAIYQTEVVNAVLEQMQGMSESEPVIVIGATNFLEKVDPALRRAGRLDQVVTLPRPSLNGLEKIFQFHLGAYRKARKVAGDVRVKRLAQLAFGLTGADVEFFVRGAARRARKERRRISQADLIAEVTRRPRHPDSVLRLTPDDMRRVAVHEAGHAIAGLRAANGTREIAYVSIVPRMDGSLGFTASVPNQGATLTRKDVRERLRTILSGRAAEEVIYGADDISLSAGGSEASDLAVATRLATQVICSAGFGSSGALQWTAAPTANQSAEIDRLLQDAYAAAVTLLRENKTGLDRLTDALVEHQELDGVTVRRLLDATQS